MPDAAETARQLADLFAQAAKAIDDYRAQHLKQLTPQQRMDLEEAIGKIDDVHDECTADAIAATLESIQSDLDRIAGVTAQAQQALQHLETVEKVTKIASAVAELGAAIMSGNYGAIPSAIEDVADAAKKDPGTSSGDSG